MNAAAITVAPPPVAGDTAGAGPDGEAAAAFAGLLTAALSGDDASRDAPRPSETELEAIPVVDEAGPTTTDETSVGQPTPAAALTVPHTAPPNDETQIEDGTGDAALDSLPMGLVASHPADADPAPLNDAVAIGTTNDAGADGPDVENATPGDASILNAGRTDGAAFRVRLQAAASDGATSTTGGATAQNVAADATAPRPERSAPAQATDAAGPAPSNAASAQDAAALERMITGPASPSETNAGASDVAVATPATLGESAPAGTTERAAATGGPRHAAPPPPANQLASAVAAMRRRGDGEYTASLDLHPAELGRVRVEVEIRAGLVNVHVNAEQSATRSLLAAQLDDLRSALTEGGLDAGQLDVSQQGWSDQSNDRDESRGESREAASINEPTEAREPIRPTTVLVPDAGLDVRL